MFWAASACYRVWRARRQNCVHSLLRFELKTRCKYLQRVFIINFMRRVHQILSVRYNKTRPYDCVRELRVLPPQTTWRTTLDFVRIGIANRKRRTSVRDWVDERGNRVLQLHHQHAENICALNVDLPLNIKPLIMRLLSMIWARGVCLRRCANARPEICQMATASTCSALESAHQQLNQLAHQSLRYQSGATDADTTAAQALKLGVGVCQDYAHLLIALCRACRFGSALCGGLWRAGRTNARLGRSFN